MMNISDYGTNNLLLEVDGNCIRDYSTNDRLYVFNGYSYSDLSNMHLFAALYILDVL